MAEVVDMAGGFESFVRRRGDSLWRAAWLLTGDEGKAEDLVQTAFAKTWRRFHEFDSDNHFESYVRTTIYRTFVSWWRARSWRSEVPVAEPLDDGATSVDPTLRLDLLRAMQSLSRIQRTVLVLRFFEDRSVAEVAAELRMPESTVKTHTRRAVAKIRESVHLQTPEE